VKNLIKETNKIDAKENDRIDEIRIISLSKLIDGGAAILAPVNKNHHIVIMGLIHIRPLVRNILRV
jgi:RIO-like serine/threonine protein kinase